MAKKKKPAEQQKHEHTAHLTVDALPDSLPIGPAPDGQHHPRRINWRTGLAGVLGLGILVFLGLIGFEQIYTNKIVPGVTAAGVYLGGMSKEAAIQAVQAKVDEFSGQQLGLTYNDKTVYLPVSSLDYKYDTAATIQVALEYGRRGSWIHQMRSRLRSLFSRPTNVAVYSFSVEKLTPVLLNASNEVDMPVSDAKLNFVDGGVGVNPSVSGKRMDLGFATLQVKDDLAKASSATVALPVYTMDPTIDRTALEAAKDQARTFLTGPLTLKVNSATYTADLPTITGWIKVTAAQSHNLGNLSLEDLSPVANPAVKLELDRTVLAAYVAGIAGKTDQVGQDAALSIQDGRAVVFRPSRNGIALDQPGAISAISEVLASPASREITLKVKVSKPTITEGSLNDLGITDLISEGVTYFPGSPGGRMTNIRVGAAKYNGVLVKPGDTFSFGKILGNVGPAEGFVPELVIVGNHEEYQYGGGLCQVASTAFRAALLGGLPITERHNHSFAVGYYTAPYGVPGVDATIFYPEADFKFLNDTGHYILIQTSLSGTTLTFDYYGTKTKSGQIRGPYFITPENGAGWNATVPSRTVFYRDILDLAGKVTKTDTITSSYQSSANFPITKQFN